MTPTPRDPPRRSFITLALTTPAAGWIPKLPAHAALQPTGTRSDEDHIARWLAAFDAHGLHRTVTAGD